MGSEEREDIPGRFCLGAVCLGQVVRQPVAQRNHDGRHVYIRQRPNIGCKHLLESANVELIGEDLDHALQQILLGHHVLYRDNVIQDLREGCLRIEIHGHAIQLTKSNEVGANEHSQIMALSFSSIFFPGRALMLDANPEPVAFLEVGEDEVESIVDVPSFPFEARASVWQLVLQHLRQVVPEEEPSKRMLHAFTQLIDVLENFLRRSFQGLDVSRPHCR
mmetsp:Transcript_72788/g.170729  ORF Transcript_72788/g.170729 Transcript_72788/m.170729 type:complete len:220 (-) Transcript_72788:302-961(-)